VSGVQLASDSQRIFSAFANRFARFASAVCGRYADFSFSSGEFRLPARGVVRVLDGSSGADYKILKSEVGHFPAEYNRSPRTNNVVGTDLSRPKASGVTLLLAVFFGLFPYIAAVAIRFTHNLRWLALIGATVCAMSTLGTYTIRKRAQSSNAKTRLLLDPFLYIFEFVFTCTILRYIFKA
jgi:hypothetical protein